MLLTAPFLVSLERIWDKTKHAAFTDLIRYKENFFCAFRGSDSHFSGINGQIHLLKSRNAVIWNPEICLEKEGWDLRDPKLSIMPDGRLMMLAGASLFNRDKKRLSHRTVVSFSSEGAEWTDFQMILIDEWLWRVTWFQGQGFGVAYSILDPGNLQLYSTSDGISYTCLSSFRVPGNPSEVTLRFFPDGQLVALIRRDGSQGRLAWIATSFPPYEDWLFNQTAVHLGGPNFLILPNSQMWAAGRILSETPYGIIEKMAFLDMSLHSLRPKLILPSGGDCGYPGMVFDPPFLWMSYYSSHEGKASIYLAQIFLPN